MPPIEADRKDSRLDERRQRDLRRITAGGAVGNVLEWYDFALFGYFAPIIGAQFFGTDNRLVSLLSAFGVFASAYFMRPVGGVLFGHIGDRHGRKRALQLSVLMMAAPTTLMALLPTYAQIGGAATLLLVLLRLVQGVSVGGELVGSISHITELAPADRRGFFGSFALCSSTAGVMLGSLTAYAVQSLLEPLQLQAWGWRMPFLLGYWIGAFALWMRSALPETPEFERMQRDNAIGDLPVAEVIRTQSGRVAQITALIMMGGGGFYMLFVWWPFLLSRLVHPPVHHALLINTIAMLVLMAALPAAGWLSDAVGRKPVLVASTLGTMVLAYPLFLAVQSGSFGSALAVQIVFALLMGGFSGPIPATMIEVFPARTRFSGIGLGYNLSLSLFGGTAPLVCTWLVVSTGRVTAPAYYLALLAVCSLVAALFLRPYDAAETRGDVV